MSRYCIISPCRDEAKFARRTLDSVCNQTVPPALWVIVDDGSKDETPRILAEYAAKYPFIRVVPRKDRGERQVGPGVIQAFNEGYRTVDPKQFDYLCKLDLDLDLPRDYFQKLIERMEANPRLGTCSGKPYFYKHEKLVSEACGDENSVGMTKFYRRQCFEEIGGFVPQVMWDGIDGHRCRMLGWIACSWDDPELRFVHLRPMGSSQKDILHGRLRHGFGQYFMGTSLPYMTASSIFRMSRPPYIVGGMAMWVGYIKSWIVRRPQVGDAELQRFVRKYQRLSLLHGKRRAMEILHEQTQPENAGGVRQVRIGYAVIDNVDFNQALERIDAMAQAQEPGYVLTPNVDHVVQLERDELLRTIYSQANLVLADGMPVVWASKYLGTPLKGRVAGSDLFPRLCELAARKKYRVFFLGGREGAGEKAIAILSSKYAGFAARSYCPPFGFEKDVAETEKIGAMIREYSPHILCVAVGAPKQEYWIYHHARELGVPVSLGVGASLDFIAGFQKRAPVFMQKIGLEWFWRLMLEPRRMYRRYLVDDRKFFSIIWRQKHSKNHSPSQPSKAVQKSHPVVEPVSAEPAPAQLQNTTA
ncbi:MAG TPA: WecB/TagA/CpsF family glycosyltransferase [Tepidisphaeraceae bacterium]|jgi:exopolysaccharide biosynthesis WecB/TagA/CpsF family protein